MIPGEYVVAVMRAPEGFKGPVQRCLIGHVGEETRLTLGGPGGEHQGRVRGTVCLNGSPQADVTLRIFRHRAALNAPECRTDAKGRFDLGPVTSVLEPARSPLRIQTPIRDPSSKQDFYVVTLRRPPNAGFESFLRGNAPRTHREPDGLIAEAVPPGHWLVSVARWALWSGNSNETDDRVFARHDFYHLPAGPATVLCALPGGKSVRQGVAVAAGKLTTIVVTVP